MNSKEELVGNLASCPRSYCLSFGKYKGFFLEEVPLSVPMQARILQLLTQAKAVDSHKSRLFPPSSPEPDLLPLEP